MVTVGRDRGDYDREQEQYDWDRYISTWRDPEPERWAEQESQRAPWAVTLLLDGPEKLLEGDAPRLSVAEIRRALSQASQRVGHSEEDRARWLVRFAVADLSQLSIGQRLDLEWEILAFLTPPPSNLLHLEKGSSSGRQDLPENVPCLSELSPDLRAVSGFRLPSQARPLEDHRDVCFVAQSVT